LGGIGPEFVDKTKGEIDDQADQQQQDKDRPHRHPGRQLTIENRAQPRRTHSVISYAFTRHVFPQVSHAGHPCF
jgi:hypothetical protein